MTDEKRLDLVRSAYHAQSISDNLNVAYWTIDNPGLFTMKTDDAHKAFADLAELLGYEVVKK